MKKVLMILSLVIVFVASQIVFAQEKPAEKKADKVVKEHVKVEKKMKCPKDSLKHCEKKMDCAKDSLKCCEKKMECAKDSLKQCEKKCEKDSVKCVKEVEKVIEKKEEVKPEVKTEVKQ